jgi:hypothetical protein
MRSTARNARFGHGALFGSHGRSLRVGSGCPGSAGAGLGQPEGFADALGGIDLFASSGRAMPPITLNLDFARAERESIFARADARAKMREFRARRTR